ncbi:MAG TPA: molybdopterin molybdotransferase MoeA [Ohtaekwangia sp.]|nr:molybdopterin molybdotransferase MoeA [Ohtaekwangia sp.]
MVSVQEASRIIFSHLYKARIVSVDVHNAVGRVLAEEVRADRDFPPFDRVAMDGIAIAYEAWKSGQALFPIQGVQAAGQPQNQLDKITHCFEVMTGSMLPKGTDTVIRYEDVTVQNGNATINLEVLHPGTHIHRQKQDAARSEILLEPGTLLSPAEIALLASVGKAEVNVFSFPVTAIVSSGDELVAVEATPEPHQIRRSNVYAIEAAMREMQWTAKRYHLPDEENILEERLKKLADENDVLILSGGVSKGKFDFIPQVLGKIGIKKVFHHVSQRPGKPFWFGVSDSGKVAFALPGNPVSTYMCFYRYIKPWLMKSLGISSDFESVMLADDFSFTPTLTNFLQVKVKNERGKLQAYPQPGGGSGDFANLKHVTGFVELEAEKTFFPAGEVVPYIPFR